jgi:hypothetical protein
MREQKRIEDERRRQEELERERQQREKEDADAVAIEDVLQLVFLYMFGSVIFILSVNVSTLFHIWLNGRIVNYR